MILVASGTGRLGQHVVDRLLSQGRSVRVLTRSPLKARKLGDAGVEVVTGDVREPATLPPALLGVRTVVSAVQGFAGRGRVTPQSVDRDGNRNLLGAAREAGAEVVMVSVVGASTDHPVELFRMKYADEETLRTSNVPYTIVRASAFTQLWEELLLKGSRPLIFGRGDKPINFVQVTAVADAVVNAVEDITVRGQVLDLVGDEDLTLNELSRAGATRQVSAAYPSTDASRARGRRTSGRATAAAAAIAMGQIDLRAPARSRQLDAPATLARPSRCRCVRKTLRSRLIWPDVR